MKSMARKLISGGVIVTLLTLGLLNLVPMVSASTTGAATLDQCTNGPVSPLQPQPCVGSTIAAVSVAIPGISAGAPTSYKNWENGNSQGAKSHWQEGEFIPYRVIISGIAEGSHTITFSYDTVHSGRHALDYLGSYDATETVSPAPTSADGTIIHANNNSPCADLVSAGQMSQSECGTQYSSKGSQVAPAVPVSEAAIPPADLSSENGCAGSSGTFRGAQVQGNMDLFAPAGSALTGVGYVSQNVAVGTTCTTTVSVTFSVSQSIGPNHAIVLAWGGHIASAVNWGAGNSASAINGSPYHMSLDALDGASLGSQDRALATSAIYFFTSTSTALSQTTSTVGATVRDTATVTGAASTASGSVTFTVYDNNTCTTEATAGAGGQISAQPGSVSAINNGSGTLTAESPFVTFQQADLYYWQAVYSGDTGTNTFPSTSPCLSEPLNVKAPSLTITKTPDASSVSAGGTIGFTITLTNGGLGDSTGTTLTDPLPSGTGISWSIASNSGPGTCTITGTAPQEIGCGTFTLNAGASETVHVISATTGASCGTYNNTANFTSSNGGSGSASASEAVLCASLSITKTPDASSVSAGGTIGFTITLTNGGAGDSTGTTLTDPLPSGPGISWAIASSSGPATCKITGTAPQEIGCGTFTLNAGASETVHVISATTGASCGTYKNTASFTSSNVSSGSASASEAVYCPSLSITKTPDASSVSAGGTIGFTITLTNGGPGDSTGTTLTDPLPSGTGISWSIAGNSGPGHCTITGTAPQEVGCGTFTLNAGASETVHVISATTGASCGTYNNTANFTSSNGGTNAASASEAVYCPSLSITKTADAPSVNAGGTIGFTITLTNAGPGDSTGTTLTDPLPSGTGISWSIASNSGPVNCTITGTASSQSVDCGTFSLAAGQTEAVQVISATTGASCGTYDNTASFTSSNAGSGSASASEAVSCPSSPPPPTPTANTPSVVTVPSAGGPVGTALSDRAYVTGISHPAQSDNVTFVLYQDSLCTKVADNLGAAFIGGPVITNGVATWTAISPGAGYAPLVAGTYYWGVTFNSVGDVSNLSSPLVCGEPVTITAASGTKGAHATPSPTPSPTPRPVGAVKGASTSSPNTGADLFMPGLLAALAVIIGSLLLMTAARIRRNREL